MNVDDLLKELNYSAVRSGGPGGQHANKVSSKVVVFFDIENSKAISQAEKLKILEKRSSKLNRNNQLILTCDESRSQHKNKQIVTNRLILWLEGALRTDKKRIPVKLRKSQKVKRLDDKKKRGLRKALRQKPKFD